GCGAVPVSGSQAACTTSALAGGTYAITGLYSGDATYAGAVAGPITQTVTGTAASASASYGLTIDSSAYVASVGQAVTFTVAVTGPVTPTGKVDFQDNGSTIAGCAGVSLSGGIARCTASSLAAGSHPIRGWYYGDANNSAGIAGPITETIQ
ncbi:MAG TPA: Ig-like domain-containing protein, partial [Usitatibacter sp.]|nr:Ig-like domain-containing protein [Usitatibacter sp.]